MAVQKQEDKQTAASKVETRGLKGRVEVVDSGVAAMSGAELLAAAQEKAPNLTQEFVDAFGLTNEDLAEIARGSVPPPPAIGPVHTADLYLTPAGWQQTPPGVKPEDVGGNAVSR
jgi:hypothetical protein